MTEESMSTEYVPLGMYKNMPDAWQTKIHAFFHLSFPLPWLIIAGVLFAGGYLIAINNGEDEKAIWFLGMECILIAALTNAVVYFEILTDGLAVTLPLLLKVEREDAKRWVFKWYKIVYWSKNNLLVGFIIGILILLTSFYYVNGKFSSDIGLIYALIITFIMGFWVGSMIWVMTNIARMFASLGKSKEKGKGEGIEISASIFDSKTSVLRIASSFLWKISIVSALIYVFGLSIIYVCSIPIEVPALVVAACFGIFLVAYFIVPQLNIHQVLVGLKRDRLQKLVEKIDQNFDMVASDPTPENIAKLRELFHLQGVVNGKRSWSFGLGELMMLIGSIVIPLLLFFLNYLLNSGQGSQGG